MKRLTIRTDTGCSVTDSELSEAFQRLAAFEDIYEELADNAVTIPPELEKLKTAGKEKTVRYKEMLGQKLIDNHIKALFERHGISFDDPEEKH